MHIFQYQKPQLSTCVFKSHQFFDVCSIDGKLFQLCCEVLVGDPVDEVVEELESHFDQLDRIDALRKPDEMKQTLPDILHATAKPENRKVTTVGFLKFIYFCLKRKYNIIFIN